MIQLHIHCDPTSWSAARAGKHCHYDPKSKQKDFARWQIKGQYRGVPITGHVALVFTFYIPIPKSASKAKRTQMLRRQILPTSPDTTNMQKLYEDCLQGIVIENDRYASDVHSRRFYAEQPGVDISVIPWEEFTGMRVNENIERIN